MRRRRRRSQGQTEDEQIMLSLSDLFAGMIGVTMIFVLFFFGHTVPIPRDLTRQVEFTDAMARHVTSIRYPNGNFAEAVYIEGDSIRVTALDQLVIPASDIPGSQVLREYLADLYLNRDGQVLIVISSGGFGTQRLFDDVLYEMGMEDERFLDLVQLHIHSNLDFIIDEKTREEYRKELER